MMSVPYLCTRNPTLSLQVKPVLGLVGTILRICRWQRHCCLPVAVAPRLPRKTWLVTYIQSTAILSVSGRSPRCAQSLRRLTGHDEPKVTEQPFRQNAKCGFSKTYTSHAYTLAHTNTLPVIFFVEFYPSYQRIPWTGADGRCSIAQCALAPSAPGEP